MLFSIGQAPVDTLGSGLYQADVAEQTLERVSREVQSGDWGFNRENNIPLQPDVNGELVLPSNTMRADPSDKFFAYVVQRGTRLYDKKNHTYNFTTTNWDLPIDVDFVFILPWDELPEPAKQYIYIRGARSFQKQLLGSETLDGFLKEDEQLALMRLSNFDTDTENFNLFRDDVESQYITQRF